MGTPAVRSVVFGTFPFSDLSASKLRPAVVLADVERGDYILCQVTSNPYVDRDAVRLGDSDFAAGSLHPVSVERGTFSVERCFSCPVSRLLPSLDTLRRIGAPERVDGQDGNTRSRASGGRRFFSATSRRIVLPVASDSFARSAAAS